MDSLLLHRRDLYRPASVSARYGSLFPYSYPFQPPQPQPLPYSLNPWTSIPLLPRDPAPYSSYYTSSLDRPGLLLRNRLDGLGSFQQEPDFRRPPLVVQTPRPSGDVGRFRSRSLASLSLRPRKKIFKQTGGGKAVEKMVQGRKRAVDVDSRQGRVKASKEALAQEARELHALFWSGVDRTPATKAWDITVEKRKIDAPIREQVKAAKHDEKPNKEESKKVARRRKNNLSRQKKKTVGIKQTDETLLESVANAEPIPERKESPIAEESAREGDGVSGWGGSIEKVKVGVPPTTEEETQEGLLVDLQRHACKSVSEFLGNSSEGEESDNEFFSESDEEKSGAQTLKGREEKAFDFFWKLIEDNQELRKLYVERCNSGKFECLVCSGIGGKFIKRYGDVVSLVMHASKILKTKRRPEHRGYGRALCAVLGWDPLRTPTLPKVISARPRGCIPSVDEAANGAIVKEKLEGISQDGNNSVDVIVSNVVTLTEVTINSMDVSSDDDV